MFKGTERKLGGWGIREEGRVSRTKRQPVSGVGNQGSFWTQLRANRSRHGSQGKFPHTVQNPRRVAELDLTLLLRPF